MFFNPWGKFLGIVYKDAASNRNGFMTSKPHRKRHDFEVFTQNLSNRLRHGDLVLRPLHSVMIWEHPKNMS